MLIHLDGLVWTAEPAAHQEVEDGADVHQKEESTGDCQSKDGGFSRTCAVVYSHSFFMNCVSAYILF